MLFLTLIARRSRWLGVRSIVSVRALRWLSNGKSWQHVLDSFGCRIEPAVLRLAAQQRPRLALSCIPRSEADKAPRKKRSLGWWPLQGGEVSKAMLEQFHSLTLPGASVRRS